MQLTKTFNRFGTVPLKAERGGKRGLAVITWVYIVLLLYIVAALVYWFIVLRQQNEMMTALRVAELKKDAPLFTQQFNDIQEQRRRKLIQYTGEGSTFLVLIIVGAAFVYRATRKQILLSQQQQKLISNALQETARLNGLTNNILVASQLETGTYRLNKQTLNLGEVVMEVAGDFKRRFPKRVIELAVTDDVFVQGEGLLLQMLLSNLLDNALKYSPQTVPVKLSVQKTGAEAILTVADIGNGIPDAEKKNVFQKFYRTGNEATRKTKGTGLGLYLCTKIVKDHHGQLTLTDNKPHGAVFTIKLKAL